MTTPPQDSGSLRYVCETSAHWTSLLSGTTVPVPSSWWLCQEASSTLADSGGAGRTITLSGSVTYQAAATGWTRRGVRGTVDEGAAFGSFTIPNVNANSALLLQMFSINTSVVGGSRILCEMESASFTTTYLSIGNQIISRVGGSIITGDSNQAGTLVVVTKLDHSRSEFGTFTQDEKLTPTWAAPGSDTTLRILGDGATAGTDATLVYQAFWTGSDAEMSDTQVQALLDALEGNMTTRTKMAAGSTTYKTVVAIEGHDTLYSDAPSAAVLDAYHGYDWTSCDGGLFVTIQNQQSIGRDSAFTTLGRCTVRVKDETGEDLLGKAIHRRLSGAETPITATVDRNDTTINVKTTQDFASSGTCYLGNEAIRYTGVTATTITGCTRGFCSPLGTATSGTGGKRFGGHHRVGNDSNQVQMLPIVSQLPRVWIGKRICVWQHVWSEASQTINHKREAFLAYAGRIVQIGDDAHNFSTVIELDHIGKDLQALVFGRDQWKGTLAGGMFVHAGRTFDFDESVNGTAPSTADTLTVVASGAAGTNQINEGFYSAGEICALLSAWLAGEKTATRINGYYSFDSPTSSNVGPRTKCRWRREHGSALTATFSLEMPGDVYSFLGIGDEEPGTAAQSSVWWQSKRTNQNNLAQGKKAPFDTLIFKPWGPGRLAQEFTESSTFEAQSESGTFYDQFSLLPASVKSSCDSSKPWGLFLLDESALIVGSLDTTTGNSVLSNCWLAPFQLTGDTSSEANRYVGRRVDEPERGPVTLRQFICLEERWSVLLKTLLYSTGTPGYNHATFDTLCFGLSAGFPGELLGAEFERSIDNMPGAEIPVCVVIDEPTKFSDLVTGDMLLRRSFMRLKGQNFEMCQWRTPLAANATVTLTEENKASPDPKPDFRSSSVLGNDLARPSIKFDYSRDFAIGRGDSYQKAFAIEDQTQVDDLGQNVALQTIKLRNTFAGSSSVGAGLESLLHDYVPIMPVFRPSLAIERSLDQRNFFEAAPGDIALVSDLYARDPLTGARGITEIASFVTATSYTLGGFTADGDKASQSGRVTCNFLDVQRNEGYAPAAQINESVSGGGFSAGYNSATPSVRCHQHQYGTSGLTYVLNNRRVVIEEQDDASYFDAGDEILIVEIDPADPANPIMWEREVLSQSGQDIVLNTALSAPAWDATKKYRVVPAKWSQVQASQKAWSYQSDEADHMVEDDVPSFGYSASHEPTTYHPKTGNERGEYIPQIAAGDGRPYDVGHERSLVDTINCYIDRKSAHQSPFLWNTVATAQSIATWNTLFAGPIFLGQDVLSSRVARALTVAPFYRSASGGSASIRVAISRTPPQKAVSNSSAFPQFNSYKNPAYKDAFSITTTWTTTSTTWQTGADATLDLGVKDIQTGMVWLVIEGAGEAECRGLGKCIEGVRTVG